MKENEKTPEEKTPVTSTVTPIVNNGKQAGQQQDNQQKEAPVTEAKKITDTPGTNEKKEETVKSVTTEETKEEPETTTA